MAKGDSEVSKEGTVMVEDPGVNVSGAWPDAGLAQARVR
jgi:hypothetical protein